MDNYSAAAVNGYGPNDNSLPAVKADKLQSYQNQEDETRMLNSQTGRTSRRSAIPVSGNIIAF